MSSEVPPPEAPQSPPETESGERQWQPLNRMQRRVIGVLIEKAKSTPEQYPLSLNALTNGCNQKSNRSPQMNLDTDQVMETLEELREMGATVELQSGGRVAKFKHRMYDWLGVSKVELAVMAELLLRGEQTVGELRGRAARMEPIADMNTLRPILQSLVDKELVLELTPEGRGQVITHALYEASELQRLRSRVEEGAAAQPAPPRAAPAPQISPDALSEIRAEMAELRAELDKLRTRVDDLTSGF